MMVHNINKHRSQRLPRQAVHSATRLEAPGREHGAGPAALRSMHHPTAWHQLYRIGYRTACQALPRSANLMRCIQMCVNLQGGTGFHPQEIKR